MSSTQRPLEWMPIAILGVVIIAVDLVIVGTELISPSKPRPADSSPAMTTVSRERERSTSSELPTSPRPSLTRASPGAVESPEGRPNGVPRFLPPASPVAASPQPANDPMPTSGAAGLSPMPRPLMSPVAIGRIGANAGDGGGPADAATPQ